MIPEIVNLGDNLGGSGYCPVLGLLMVPYGTAGYLGGCRGGRWVFFIRELERACERGRCGIAPSILARASKAGAFGVFVIPRAAFRSQPTGALFCPVVEPLTFRGLFSALCRVRS